MKFKKFEEQMFTQINIKLNVMLRYKENEELKSLSLQLPNYWKVSDLIREAVDLYNKKFVEEKSRFRFNQAYSNYVLKPSKKSGKPDNDMPSIVRLINLECNNNTLVSDTGITTFALIYKPEDLNYQNKSSKCKDCVIF